jgi:polar amino acid transport system substrate-binding protein
MSFLIRTVLVMTFTLYPMSHAQDSMTVVADPWCPYNCADTSNNLGIMIELAQAALAPFNITVHYQNINWARAGHLVMEGSIEAIVGTSKSPSSAQKFHFPSIPLAFSQVCFYRKSGSDWTFDGADSLTDQTLGWINHYKFGELDVDQMVQAGLENGNVVPVSGDTELIFPLIRMLETERISTFGEVKMNVDYAQKSLSKKPNIEVAGCLDNIDGLYVAFSPNKESSIELADKLDEGMKGLLEGRTRVDAIFAKYGIDANEYYDQLNQQGVYTTE